MDKTEIQRIYSILKKVDFLYNLSVSELETLVSRMKCVVYRKKKAIIKQGQAGDSFFIISRGKVSVWHTKRNKDRAKVKYLGPEDYFGEMYLLAGEPRNADVIA